MLLIGHFGGPNVGDELMLARALDLLEPAGPVLVSAKPGTEYAEDGRSVTTIPRLSGQELRAALSSSATVLVGGTHFHDEYAGRRHLHHLLSMLRYIVLVTLARLRGRPAVLLGMGFGPVRRRSTRAVLRWALLVATHVTVRDASSARVVRSRKIRTGQDLAFGLDLPQAGLSATRTCAVAPSSGPAEREFWMRAVVRLAPVLGELGYRLRLVVMSGGGPEGDAHLVEKLAANARQHCTVEVVASPESWSATAQAVGSAHVVVASRYHSLVLAMAYGRPTVLVAYHGKCLQLVEEAAGTPGIRLAGGLEPRAVDAVLGHLRDLNREGLPSPAPVHSARPDVHEQTLADALGR